jgi:hypothetical protein
MRNQRVLHVLFFVVTVAALAGAALRDPGFEPQIVHLPEAAAVGQSFTGSVTLNGTAPSNVAVSLTSSNNVSVPTTITVPQGQSSQSFTGTAVSAGSASVTAAAGGVSKTGTMTLDIDPRR